MKAFVTGSTGFLGSTLVRQLLANGYEVVAMARDAAKGRKILGDTKATIVVGDMLDIPAFASQMAGCDVLFHVAAYFKEYTGIDADAERLLQTINVDGTIGVIEAAKAQGIKNVIYVSSGGVIGAVPSGVADENAPYNLESGNRYFHSKIRAEQALEKWLPKHPDMRVIQILPGAIIGPGDNGPTGMGKMMIEVAQEKLPASPSGGMMLVDVRDVTKALIAVIDQGRSGERYLVTGQPVQVSDLTRMIAEANNVSAPSITLPYFMLLAYATVMEMVARITGGRPQATRVLVRTLNEGIDTKSDKAKQELGVTFRPIRESVQDEVAWFKANGYI